MSRVTLRLYALMRLKLGEKQLELEAGTVADALAGLVARLGGKVGDLIYEGERFRENYVVMLRGHRIRQEDFGRTALSDGDELHLFPPVGGGSGAADPRRAGQTMSGSSGRLIVFMTCEKAEEARKIAMELLRRRKAACVNVLARGESFYWWKGEIESAGEHLLVAKTTEALLPALIEIVKRIHGYEVPEIVSVTIEGGSADYLAWLDRELEQRG